MVRVSAGWDVSSLRVLTKNGKICESCCGGPPAEPCRHCSQGQTPKKYSVTFAGVVATGACWGMVYTASGGIDGTYIIPQSPWECTWTAEFPDASSLIYYHHKGIWCEGEIDGEYHRPRLYVRVEKVGANMICVGAIAYPSGPGTGLPVFDGCKTIESGKCKLQGEIITNQNTPENYPIWSGLAIISSV